MKPGFCCFEIYEYFYIKFPECVMKTTILLMLFLIPACSVFEDETQLNFPAGVDSLSVEITGNKTAEFTAYLYCGSMCWTGYYFVSDQEGNDIYVKLFVTTDGRICPAVCVEQSYKFEYTSLYPGTYNFHFFRTDTTSLDTTISFN